MRTKTKTVPRRILNRHLPAVLLKHRQTQNQINVMRARDAHDHRLPENLVAKARAAYAVVQRAAAEHAVNERLAALAKQAEANLKAALDNAPALPFEVAADAAESL